MAELVFAQTAQDLDGRTGYEPSFLGVDVPVPELTTGHPTAVFLYLHYSVLFRPDRRFAAVTALALDGAHLFSVERSDSWGLDHGSPTSFRPGPRFTPTTTWTGDTS